MAGWLAVVIMVVVFGSTLGSLPVIAHRPRRQGGGSILAPFEEIWHPAAHRARVEIEVHDERVAPPAAPGDPLDLRPQRARRS